MAADMGREAPRREHRVVKVAGGTKGCKGCGKNKDRALLQGPAGPTIVVTPKGAHVEEHDEEAFINGAGSEHGSHDSKHPRMEEERVVKVRRMICSKCDEKVHDEKGNDTDELIKRLFEGQVFCGDFQEPRTDTEPERFGCGCNIFERTRWHEAACPRLRWGPGQMFDARHIPIMVQPKETIPKTLDYIGPAHITKGNFLDYAGIGDTMQQAVIAQALHRINATQGINVRFTTVTNKIPWAKFALCDEMEVLDVSDDSRIMGQHFQFSSHLKMVELDATCEMNGQNRLQYIASRFDLPANEIDHWKVHINPEAEAAALEFLKVPKKEARPIVAVCPFANSSMRQWPLRHFSQLIERLKKAGFAVYVLDAPRPKGHLVYRLPIRRFQHHDPHMIAAVIKHTDIVVSNDSGMAHLAGFVGTKAAAICGVTRGTTVFGNWATVTPIQAPGECTGCSYYQDQGWEPWCSWGCNLMNDLKPRDVEHRVIGIVRD